MHPTTIYSLVNRWTQPCRYSECPHDRKPENCEAYRLLASFHQCPSSHRPHDVRRGRITHDLNNTRPPEAISKPADEAQKGNENGSTSLYNANHDTLESHRVDLWRELSFVEQMALADQLTEMDGLEDAYESEQANKVPYGSSSW